MANALSDHSVRYFLDQAGRIPLLTIDEELLVARDVQRWVEMRDQEDCPKKVRRRGERAYQRMFSANLRLVANVAKKYQHIAKSLELEDLLQEGCIGLARAVEKFDPTRGYKFSTYAYWWIRQSITRAVTQHDRVIRLPVNGIEALTKLRKWVPLFNEEFGRNPSLEECAEHLGIRPVLLEGYLAHADRPSSLDRAAHDEKGSQIVELIPSDEQDLLEALSDRIEREKVEESLPKLAPVQQDVLSRRLGLGPYIVPQRSKQVMEERGVTKGSVYGPTQQAVEQLQLLFEAA